ncbi:hypothetical protein AKJ09_09186 [Labilithrix luteola]|uniref:Uncharacterized protein n=1 Tax=Labilithrix luteola TaxID=1391654 RepID=A0A0K1Q9W2_9BACT|nr:hypothetical protein AKJ09_09186 [Labilithrix luteola]
MVVAALVLASSVSSLAFSLSLSPAFAQVSSSSAPGTYGTARPAECVGLDGLRTTNVWERAKEPQLRRYCDLLASGTAKLVGDGPLAKDVLTIADEADRLLAGRAAPSVLRGRALLRLGKPQAALEAFQEAVKRDDRALDDPVALLAWARANARTKHFDEAAQAYRAALPRTSTLPAQERAAASFEAGMIVMAQGPNAIDAAVAMLKQARRDSQDALQVASVVGLALALDRAGQRDEAKAVLAERVRDGAKALLKDARVLGALSDAGVPEESDALAGMALEGVDAAGAREAWKKYLDGPGGKGPWASHASGHEGVGAPSKKGTR